MHPDMAGGAIPGSEATAKKGAHNATGAGFTDTATGTKIRVAESYAHTIEEVVEAARGVGFEVVEGVEERGVEQGLIDGGVVDGGRGRKWVVGGVKCWFGGLLRLGV